MKERRDSILSNPFWSTNVLVDEEPIDVDVVVIGAGCAGLECAQQLYNNGFEKVVVLEAQDYIGGRMKTILLDEDECKPLEMGANWVHGLWGNPLYKLIQENGDLFHHKKKTLFTDGGFMVHFVDEYGRALDPLMCLSFYDMYHEWNQDAKQIWRQNLRTTYESYAEFMYAKLAAHTANDTEEVKKIKYALMKRMLLAETVESGSKDMTEVSLNEYGSYEIPIGPDYEFPGGYGTLIQFLADKLPEDSIKLSSPVRHIELTDKKHSDELLGPLLVHCFNGIKYRAKHVVCTVSSAYLKRHYKSLISPALLNEQKVLAINSMGMDTVDKIFLFYDDMSFFPPQIDSVHPIFLNTDAEFGPRIEDNWPTQISSINRIGYDNCLLLWITGKAAHYIEQLDDSVIAERLTDLMRRFLGTKDVPEPTKIIKTNWHSNPYILGSYSFIHRNSKSASADVNNLAAPIYVDNIPRLLFAGEATHLRYYSTVHAAYLSGQREAQRIIKHSGNDKLIFKTRSRI